MAGAEPQEWGRDPTHGSTFIGLDVHKETTSVAIAQGERGGAVRHWGMVPHRSDHLRKLIEKLAAGGAQLHFCYAAGPCGDGLHRQIVEMGHDCIVVAPSLIPVLADDRVKTDRRDAVMLAKPHRAGELTAVRVPDAAHEAMRDLVRARTRAMRVAGKARRHLQGFLLRHSRIYPGKKGWTGAYRRWLAMVRFTHPARQIALEDYIDAIADAGARVERLTGQIADQIADLLPTWSLAPVVEALQAMRGVGFIVAVTVVAEVGDFQRFDNPRRLMACLGLTPSEHSSGASVRRGGITIWLRPERPRWPSSRPSRAGWQASSRPLPAPPRQSRLEGATTKDTRPIPMRRVGDGRRRGTLVPCHEPTTSTLAPGPRQPQDETTVMRQPTRA